MSEKEKGHPMPVLPFCVTGLIGGFVAYMFSLFDRGQNLWRLANYPVGVLAATAATWITQNLPNMHNKLLVLAFTLPSVALVLFHMARRMWLNRRRIATRVESFS